MKNQEERLPEGAGDKATLRIKRKGNLKDQAASGRVSYKHRPPNSSLCKRKNIA
jgi:hypothetical protein